MRIVQTGQSRRTNVLDNGQRNGGQRHTRRSAEQSQQHALGQKLPDNPHPARAHCRANADLALPRGGSGQQQFAIFVTAISRTNAIAPNNSFDAARSVPATRTFACRGERARVRIHVKIREGVRKCRSQQNQRNLPSIASASLRAPNWLTARSSSMPKWFVPRRSPEPGSQEWTSFARS